MHKSTIEFCLPDTDAQNLCPSCGAPIPSDFKLEDGDTVPGTYGEKNEFQKSITGICSVLVGKASCCGKYLFYIEAQTVHVRICKDYEEGISWFQDNSQWYTHDCILPQKSLTARYKGLSPDIPKNWSVNVIATGRGCAMEHMIGPFVLKDTSIIGEYGVSHCGCGGSDGEDVWKFADQTLNFLWNDFCCLIRDFHYGDISAEQA